jgi:hypothetical protein
MSRPSAEVQVASPTTGKFGFGEGTLSAFGRGRFAGALLCRACDRPNKPGSTGSYEHPVTSQQQSRTIAATHRLGRLRSGSEERAPRSGVVVLLAHRAAESAAVVVTREGKNAFARFYSVRRRAISDARSGVVVLLAHRAAESAAVVVTREGKNAFARFSSVRRRAISDARSTD